MSPLTLILGLALGCLYVAPVYIAKLRHKRNWPAIWVLTMFLGWTGIGWIIALIWALTVDEPVQQLSA